MNLVLLPFQGIAQSTVERLAEDLKASVGDVRVATASTLPRRAYNPRRRQYAADRLLDVVRSTKGDKVLGLTEEDLYVESMNFVFGLAERPGRAAVISARRLHAGGDEGKFRERLVTEAVHELGHTMGLRHCDNPGCVMHFSNTLADTDRKSTWFCRRCLGRLATGEAKRAI